MIFVLIRRKQKREMVSTATTTTTTRRRREGNRKLINDGRKELNRHWYCKIADETSSFTDMDLIILWLLFKPNLVWESLVRDVFSYLDTHRKKTQKRSDRERTDGRGERERESKDADRFNSIWYQSPTGWRLLSLLLFVVSCSLERSGSDGSNGIRLAASRPSRLNTGRMPCDLFCGSGAICETLGIL